MTQYKNNILEKYKDELQNIIIEYFKNAEITFRECNNILQKWNYENKKLDNEAFIYFAFHKKDNKLFYIGYTTKILEDRLNQKIQANEFRLKLFDYYREEFCKKNISLKEFDANIINFTFSFKLLYLFKISFSEITICFVITFYLCLFYINYLIRKTNFVLEHLLS